MGEPSLLRVQTVYITPTQLTSEPQPPCCGQTLPNSNRKSPPNEKKKFKFGPGFALLPSEENVGLLKCRTPEDRPRWKTHACSLKLPKRTWRTLKTTKMPSATHFIHQSPQRLNKKHSRDMDIWCLLFPSLKTARGKHGKVNRKPVKSPSSWTGSFSTNQKSWDHAASAEV